MAQTYTCESIIREGGKAKYKLQVTVTFDAYIADITRDNVGRLISFTHAVKIDVNIKACKRGFLGFWYREKLGLWSTGRFNVQGDGYTYPNFNRSYSWGSGGKKSEVTFPVLRYKTAPFRNTGFFNPKWVLISFHGTGYSDRQSCRIDVGP